MALPPQQPPGWYYAQGDPPGTQRWWDGNQWVGGPVAGTGAPVGQGGEYGAPGAYGTSPGYGYGVPAGYGYGAAGYGRPAYASWWRRFGAYILDSLIVGIPGAIVQAVAGAAVPTKTTFCEDLRGNPALCEEPTGAGWAILILVWALVFAMGVAYYVYFHGRTGQTIGKKAVGITVVDQRTGRPIGTGRAIGRYFGAILSGIACALGYLWAAWDDQKQTWHDKMVSSIVIVKP